MLDFKPSENLGQLLIIGSFLLLINSERGRAVWQEQVLARFSDAAVQAWGTFAVGFAITWTMYLIFFVIDLTGAPAFITSTKVQPAVPVTLDMYKKALPRVLFNSLVTNALLAYAGSFSPIQLKVSVQDFPTTLEFLRDIAVCGVVTEFGFYTAHYGFHHKSIYKYIHKIHHEFTAPMALVSTYAHPLEHVLANVLPIAIGPFLMRSHILVAFCFTIMGIVNTACVHSGYLVPFFEPCLAHDYHHMKFNYCFGTSLGICDWMFGTTPSEAELKQVYQSLKDKEKVKKN
ncbi:hypothetical protein BC830DRAFT_1108042 [Chytriomyces sp. MP71]|nr:hypothetical protein BC830DRAFT_1108042 [Chytriomyces sp. MP71]